MEWRISTLVTACGGAAATGAWEFSKHTVFDFVSVQLKAHGVDPPDVIAHGSTFVLPSAVFACGLYVAYRLGHYRGAQQLRQPETDGAGSTTIVIKPQPALLRKDLKFGVLYVRDGRDELPEHGKLRNKDIPFEELDKRGTLVATIKHDPILGCQFKCFIEHRGLTSDQVKPFLERSGFKEPDESMADPFRTYFLLTEYPTCKTMPEGWTNNINYPK